MIKNCWKKCEIHHYGIQESNRHPSENQEPFEELFDLEAGEQVHEETTEQPAPAEEDEVDKWSRR